MEYKTRMINASFSERIPSPKPSVQAFFSITQGVEVPGDITKEEYLAELEKLKRGCETIIKQWEQEYFDHCTKELESKKD